MPRAATSEQTSSCSSSALNLFSVAKRLGWSMSPCSAPTEKPCRLSDLYRMSTSTLRLQKISAFFTASRRSSRRSASRLSVSRHQSRPAVIVVATEAGAETLISFGLLRKASASLRISGAMVAEKNMVCRSGGSIDTIRSTSGMKPMSSIRSASSMTSTLQSASRMRPRSNRSSSRPGVAISTSTPFSSTARWSFMLSPPISSACTRLRCLPYFTNCSATCRASSRVGSRIRLRGMRALARPLARMSIIGRVKPAVLPVPVWAQPSTSRPISTTGMACSWIGVGVT